MNWFSKFFRRQDEPSKVEKLKTDPRRDGYLIMKTLIVGPRQVGKSSLLTRVTDGTFTDSFISTIGVDFKIKRVKMEAESLKVQLWDHAQGRERFRTITRAYYRGANCVMVMFDVSERETLEEARFLIKEVREGVTDEATPIVLIGNKTDKHRVISTEEAEEFAVKEGLRYFEMSVKKDENVDETVAEVLRLGAEMAFPDLQDWAAAEVDLGQRNDQDTIQRIYSPGAHGPNLLCKSAAKVMVVVQNNQVQARDTLAKQVSEMNLEICGRDHQHPRVFGVFRSHNSALQTTLGHLFSKRNASDTIEMFI